ncbi:hypothetical protein FSP39_013207 [Pinctada imbricata]|uniref:Uncharacterized protein n=1 Tax=Pinctada imbricata TaxID=66713 RepID=A0AA88XIR0_PINIB|nr:hypothetical protein FSP39_013207 [Pinctada imbricata]
MRTNEGVYGSFHPYDVKETVHQYFSLNKQSSNNVEQHQMQNKGEDQSKFDPNGESMFGGKQSAVWKFASVYDPNKNVHKYIAGHSGMGSLGPSGSGVKTGSGGFDPEKLNAEIMGMIQQQHFSPGMGTDINYDGSQGPSQSRYTMVSSFDPNRLNQELIHVPEYKPEPTTTGTVTLGTVQQFGPTGEQFKANMSLPNRGFNNVNMTENGKDNSSTDGALNNVNRTVNFGGNGDTNGSNATANVIVSKNPALTSGYHAVSQGIDKTGNGTTGTGVGSQGPFPVTNVNIGSANPTGSGNTGEGNTVNKVPQAGQNGANGGNIQASGIGSLGTATIDQTGAFNSKPLQASGIGGLGGSEVGMPGSSNGSPVATGIGSLNGGGSNTASSFQPGSIGLPGIQSSSTSGGLPGISGTGSGSTQSSGGSAQSAANFQNSVFASSKAQATGIGTLGGTLTQSGANAGGNAVSATGIGTLGAKSVTQTGVSKGNDLSQNGESVAAQASGIGSLDPNTS